MKRRHCIPRVRPVLVGKAHGNEDQLEALGENRADRLGKTEEIDVRPRRSRADCGKSIEIGPDQSEAGTRSGHFEKNCGDIAEINPKQRLRIANKPVQCDEVRAHLQKIEEAISTIRTYLREFPVNATKDTLADTRSFSPQRTALAAARQFVKGYMRPSSFSSPPD